jgi:hypothetical protein
MYERSDLSINNFVLSNDALRKDHIMSTVGTPLHTFRDASGKITVTVFTHQGSPEQEIWIDEQILVADSDMVAIGGGGAASDGFENTLSQGGPGSFLTASFPNDNLTGWIVGARDQQSPQTYGLRTFVIGMKIAGLSRQQLSEHIILNTSDSGAGPHPQTEAGIPSNSHVLVGGGFQVDQGRANLGTASFPSSPFSWTVSSQDHSVPSPANIRAYAIGISNNLPGVGRVVSDFTNSTSGQGPHPQAVATVNPGFALTGGGAQVQDRVIGNLLWKLVPTTDQTPSYTVASRDHFIPAPATVTAFAVGLRIG